MEFVKYEEKGFVGIVTIDRPKALNALSDKVLEELSQVFDSIDTDKTRCVILTGAGEKSFVAGADIGEMASLSKEQAIPFADKGNAVMLKIESFPIPVIAAVNGFALGGGCELALSCDIRLAAENAVFAQPEVTLGITAGYGGTQRLARIIGQSKAKKMLYTGERVKSGHALEMGLVDGVFAHESLMDEAMSLAEKIAANAPVAVKMTKEAINKGYSFDIADGVKLETSKFSQCFATEDQKNAMSAFLDKRKVDSWLGR